MLRKPEQLVGRYAQNLAHLVDQREARLHLCPLVARIAVLLDSERLGEVACAIEPALRPHRFQALCELRTHFRCESSGHNTFSFADPAQFVIVRQCISKRCGRYICRLNREAEGPSLSVAGGSLARARRHWRGPERSELPALPRHLRRGAKGGPVKGSQPRGLSFEPHAGGGKQRRHDGHQPHPQFLHHRPHRSRQVHLVGPADPVVRQRHRPGDEGADPRTPWRSSASAASPSRRRPCAWTTATPTARPTSST